MWSEWTKHPEIFARKRLLGSKLVTDIWFCNHIYISRLSSYNKARHALQLHRYSSDHLFKSRSPSPSQSSTWPSWEVHFHIVQARLASPCNDWAVTALGLFWTGLRHLLFQSCLFVGDNIKTALLLQKNVFAYWLKLTMSHWYHDDGQWHHLCCRKDWVSVKAALQSGCC